MNTRAHVNACPKRIWIPRGPSSQNLDPATIALFRGKAGETRSLLVSRRHRSRLRACLAVDRPCLGLPPERSSTRPNSLPQRVPAARSAPGRRPLTARCAVVEGNTSGGESRGQAPIPEFSLDLDSFKRRRSSLLARLTESVTHCLARLAACFRRVLHSPRRPIPRPLADRKNASIMEVAWRLRNFF